MEIRELAIWHMLTDSTVSHNLCRHDVNVKWVAHFVTNNYTQNSEELDLFIILRFNGVKFQILLRHVAYDVRSHALHSVDNLLVETLPVPRRENSSILHSETALAAKSAADRCYTR
jgi:hypothetical protein